MDQSARVGGGGTPSGPARAITGRAENRRKSAALPIRHCAARLLVL